MRSIARINDVFRQYRKQLLFTGSAAALLGMGGGIANAAVTPATHVPAAHVPAAHATAKAAVADRHGAAHPAVVRHAVADRDRRGPGRVGDRHAKARAKVAASRVDGLGMLSWSRVAEVQAHRADPGLRGGALPAADVLRPVPVVGPQEFMPVTAAQLGNAKTIVAQALLKKMGVRSAVIAVATAMQESTLTNISYGTSDSLGLFQQRPSCGWGSAAQIMNPAYASDAFLSALQRYQAANPGWAHQPLWQSAQGVQASGFPTAYAKWEAQAAGLVQHVTTQLTR